MWRKFWIAASVVGLLSAGLVWASANSVFLYKHPFAPDARIVIDHETGGAVVMKEVVVVETVAKAPRVVTPATDHDFGTMNPHTTARHHFVVENQGDAPLTLAVGGSSCKCTVAGLDQNEIAAGERTKLTLEWTTGDKPLYSHYATIRTNDPTRKSIDFVVHGKVLMEIGIEHPEIVLDTIDAGEQVVASTHLYSQIWDSFTVLEVTSGLAGFEWKVLPASPADAPELRAKSLQRLQFTIPADATFQNFSDTLRVTIQSPDRVTPPRTLDVPVHRRLRGQIAFFGKDIVDDAIDFGTIPFGQGRKSKVLVKIRDRDPNLGEVQVQSDPAFLRAQLVPRPGESAKGLYDLLVELPPETPPCQFLATPQGELRISTTHPRLPKFKINVRFAVLQQSAL
jgi:hypothetical protein